MGGKGSGRKPSPCGTDAKYQWHRARGEDCTPCREAHAAARRARYKPKKTRSYVYVKGRRTSFSQRQNQIRETIIAEKLARGECLDCRLTVTIENYFVFAFDHRNPNEKEFQLSNAANAARDLATVHIEMAKCDLVCHNCHMMRTWKNRHYLARKDIEMQPTLFAV
jgi:hypothetical protein